MPTCLQMIMYRQGIPLVAAEVLGYELGLIVPEEDRHLYWHARTGQRPVTGWGTQISKPEFSPNAAFTRLGIPLSMSFDLIDQFDSVESMRSYLKEIEEQDADVLACYDYGKLFNTDFHGGHVNIFDRLTGSGVRLIDPERNVPKWRQVSPDSLFEAMKFNVAKKSGFWKVSSL